MNIPRQLANELFGAFAQHHLLAEGVESLNIGLALLGLAAVAPRPLSDAAHDQAAHQEGGHRHPGSGPG